MTAVDNDMGTIPESVLNLVTMIQGPFLFPENV